MARKDSEHQKKSMSALFKGRAIFKPLNTGRIDERVACVREWVANIFFYTKGDATVMIDAGYNYARLREKMGWLDIDPASIKHIGGREAVVRRGQLQAHRSDSHDHCFV